MSFFDRLGQVAKDVAGFVAAPAKFAWDVGTAPWNNDEHFNGFANTIATASKNLGTSLVKPIQDVAAAPVISGALSAINTVNQNLIREPLTTLNLVAADAVSAVIGRRPFTTLLIRLGETSISAASRRADIPIGFRNSSSKISPGCISFNLSDIFGFALLKAYLPPSHRCFCDTPRHRTCAHRRQTARSACICRAAKKPRLRSGLCRSACAGCR